MDEGETKEDGPTKTVYLMYILLRFSLSCTTGYYIELANDADL